MPRIRHEASISATCDTSVRRSRRAPDRNDDGRRPLVARSAADYDAEGHAIFTLRELEAWLAIQIAHPIHTALLQPPLTAWRDLQDEVDFDLPPDRMAFWAAFLPESRRRLAKDGIHFEKIRYRRQTDLIGHLEGSGQDTEAAFARALLVRLEDSLALLVDDRDRIGRELVDFDGHYTLQARFSNVNESA